MEKTKKVSIIAPCYNGESYVTRFLDSILSQTYNNIELIFVDDGSFDKTKDIVDDYMKKFKEKNIEFKYLYQENQGLAGAVNYGLKHVTGDYLTWMDSDDILKEDSIEMKVEFLNNHPDIVWLRGEGEIVNEDDLTTPTGYFKRKDSNKLTDNLFEKLIFQKDSSVYNCNFCYMTRTKELFDVLQDNSIFVSRVGQNWQLLLPLAYNFPCGYLNKVVGCYVVRSNSHSHELMNDYKKLAYRTYDHEEILIETLKRLSFNDKSKLIRKIRKKYSWIRLFYAVYGKNQELLNDICMRPHSLNFLYYIFEKIGINNLSFFLIRVINRLKKLLFIPS